MSDKTPNFCDYNGSVGKCGLFVGYGSDTRCKRHQKLPQRSIRAKIGRYSGASMLRKKEGYKGPGRDE